MTSIPSFVSTIHGLRTTLMAWREKGETVAFVPTMGALHRGHIKLVTEARKIAKRVVVSIFVNPAQFSPAEDFKSYPRQPDEDQKMLSEAGCDLIYMPDAKEMYPDDFVTTIDPGPLATVLEGAIRPTHFRGVATIVIKLLLQILSDAALFGEKDFQQLQIIRQAVRDLNIPIHIIGAKTVRDPDGLALSSRNAYLTAAERGRAIALPRMLVEIGEAIRNGGDIEALLAQGRKRLAEAGFTVDYVELADTKTFKPVRDLNNPARLLAAGKIGATRLIDNVAV